MVKEEKFVKCDNCGLETSTVYIVPKAYNSLNKDLKVCQNCHKVFRPEVEV